MQQGDERGSGGGGDRHAGRWIAARARTTVQADREAQDHPEASPGEQARRDPVIRDRERCGDGGHHSADVGGAPEKVQPQRQEHRAEHGEVPAGDVGARPERSQLVAAVTCHPRRYGSGSAPAAELKRLSGSRLRTSRIRRATKAWLLASYRCGGALNPARARKTTASKASALNTTTQASNRRAGRIPATTAASARRQHGNRSMPAAMPRATALDTHPDRGMCANERTGASRDCRSRPLASAA